MFTLWSNLPGPHILMVKKKDVHANGKGKGKGKGKGNGGFSRSPRPPIEPPKFQASIQCKWCGRKGHYDSYCWDKCPEKRPKGFVPKPEAKKSNKATFGNSKNHPDEEKKWPNVNSNVLISKDDQKMPKKERPMFCL